MSFGGVVSPLPTEIYVPPTPPASFTSFQAIDASHDNSAFTVFLGRLRVDYSLMAGSTALIAPIGTGGSGGTPPPPPPPPPPSLVDHVSIEFFQGTTRVAELGSFKSMTATNALVNLAGVSLPSGTVTVKAHAYFTNASSTESVPQALTIKTGQVVMGDFTAQTFDVSALSGDGILIHGRGGTDVLKLNAAR